MKNLFSRFVADESGATAIEYGLIAAGISVAIIAVVQGIGTNLNTKFGEIKDALGGGAGGGGGGGGEGG
jgi:pilus assembly protein Flp/PilA